MWAVPLALVLDGFVGDPPRWWARTGHPVAWMGRAIAAADEGLNKGGARRLKGAAALCGLLALFVLPAVAVGAVLAMVPGGFVVEAVIASVLLAHRSLHQHVAAVAAAPSLAQARTALAMIVGRDVSGMDEAQISGAALETLGESLSDGVVAPALWFALLGLPGIVGYKLVNTADSMIGHRSERHRDFGWAAARLDDALNIVPARLTALAILLSSPRALPQILGVWRDARRHVSPNAGWPEAALARALGVAIGGPRRYGTRLLDGAWLNAGGRAAQRIDIKRGVRVSARTGLLQILVYVALALLWP